MFLNLFLIVIGCVLLFFGAEWLVSGATVIAEKFHIPKSIAGLTLVALGTSAPELFVNLISAWQGETDFAMSNIAGSNLANLCIGFGTCALIGSVVVPWKTFRIDLCFFLVTPLIVVCGLLIAPVNTLPLATSILLSIVLMAYFVSVIRRSQDDEDETQEQTSSSAKGILLLVVGSLSLYFGAEMVLRASIAFSQQLGISDAIIGLTIVAAGTSIPDITASVVAIRKKENDIAVGNLLGSNVSNIAFVLNATLITGWSGLTIDATGTKDYFAVLILSGAFVGALCFRQQLSRQLGIGLIVFYVGFIGWRIKDLI